MIEVDPQFQKSKARAKARRAKRQRAQLALLGGGALALVLVSATGWFILRAPPGNDTLPDAAAPEITAESDDAIMQMEPETTASPIRVATPFVDIAGDPMILRFADSGDQGKVDLTGPPALDAARVGNPGPARLTLLTEPLIVQERQLITALPSSREDFAFFQAQRSASLNPSTALPERLAPSRSEGDTTQVAVAADSDDSWGTALGSDATATPVSYTETRIENTTSIAFVRPEAQRQAIYQDIVVRLVTARGLADVLGSNGFASDTASALAEQTAAIVPAAADPLPPGSIVAVRARPEPDGLQLLQMSLYGSEGFIDSVARRGTLGLVRGGDPWIGVDLFALSAPQSDIGTGPAADQDFRLLDAIYSAAIRKGVPTTLVGELIVMLSQIYDLEAFAAPGDAVTLLYAPQPGPNAEGPGQILFAGIDGPSGDMPCYVLHSDDGYGCITRRGKPGAGGALGFVTPVAGGTLSSPFGPRFHPILKTVRLHGGVDWAAPTGTPVLAALDGTVAVAGDGGGYGNVVYIDHAGGLQSRYAHLNAFAEGLRKGQQVRAGDVIGQVGTTGRSTGPHLHFEIRRGGAPVDPFTALAGGVTAASGPASGAVDALVNQIIRVESAGNANAKNPLSTATGLGQFIESTWLRMMRDYRPDLARTMSRADLLALRTDPTISREMVENLARENERFLAGRGHGITSGRLYLAHFLGPGGASKVLGSPEGATILAVMGQGVVNANPFLRNYTVADLKAWADRKMRGAGSRPSTPVATPAPVLTAEMRGFIDLIDALLQEAG